ncbi:MAG TPA: amino acid adenylation domain-containing protein, partial [Candidatus Deferrimicrobium sp.]|nr:amino acid adenylation domain-containing protein [Candidatus Deferrimicrobium sp.]
TLAAFENQEYPFENLVEKVVVNRDTGRNPLFDVIFVLQNIENVEIAIPGLLLKSYEFQSKISKFDLTLAAVENGNKVVFSIEYCTALFKEETVKRFIRYFNKLISSMLEEPGQKIFEMEILPAEERKQILYDFNDNAAPFPLEKTINQLVEEQVEKFPDCIALVFSHGRTRTGTDNICIAYRELNEQSNNLAGSLREKGMVAGSIVAVMIERSLEMIIGILGILKLGGAYLPIAPDYPQERIDYMLKDSGAKIVVNSELIKNVSFHHSSFIIHHSNFANDLAYIIYTSGTTGRPKGVMVEHRNVIRLVKNTDYVEFRESDRILQTGALEFDASTFEIWGALLNGLMLFLVKKEQVLSPAELRKNIEKYGISLLWLTSSLFNRLVDVDIEIFAPLRNLLVGGEALSPVHINKVRARFAHLNIINGYGPTENTTFSTTYRVNKEYKDNIPIGRPIANSTAYIIDRWNRLQPIGAAGELYVGGHGVARGYLNNPELTAERFKRMIHDRLYRTGDLARWLPDGNIEFSGRIDHQVKIRGFRIEPGEIENRLLNYPGIKEAVVLVQEEGHEKYICAYLVSDGNGITGLHETLAKELPDYMIPSYFISLEKIPLTANGKIDRQALPKPELKADQDYVAPRNKMEERLVGLWGEVLNIKPEFISIDSSFFQLGGHSLKAAILASRIHKEFNVLLPLAELFKTPTIRGLSGYMMGKAEDVYESIMPVEEKEYYSLSSAQKRLFV